MRILGIDHGTKRIGLALSDDLGMIAQPVGYLTAQPLSGIWKRLQTIHETTPLDRIVVGMPRNMDGSYGRAADTVNLFIDQLRQKIDLPVETWDERLTSVIANRTLVQAKVTRKKRKGKVDTMAAAIILQGWLDRHQTGRLN